MPTETEAEPDESKLAVANRIIFLQEKAGFTQEAAARAVDVTLNTWQRWRAGQTKPGFDNIVAICRTFGGDPWWLLTGESATSAPELAGPPYPAWVAFLAYAREGDEPITDEEIACLAAIRLPAGRQPKRGFYTVVWEQMRALSEPAGAPSRPSKAAADPVRRSRSPRRNA